MELQCSMTPILDYNESILTGVNCYRTGEKHYFLDGAEITEEEFKALLTKIEKEQKV